MRKTGNIVLFSHPKPAYLSHAEACLEDITEHKQNLGKEVYPRVVETHPTPEGMQARLGEYVMAGDTIAVVGGDGTWRHIHSGIMDMADSGSKHEKQYVASISSIALGGGNGGDITRAQHGRLGRRFMRPSTKIMNSVKVSAHALRVEAILAGDPAAPEARIDEWAMSYAGFGKTAIGAELLAGNTYAKHPRYYRDLHLGVKALSDMATFRFIDTGGYRVASDLTLGKGHCIGKIGKLPIEHWKEGMVVAETRPGPLMNLAAAAGFVIGHGIGHYSNRSYSFMPYDPIMMHLDGDHPRQLQPKSNVTITPSSATYNMLVTRPVYQDWGLAQVPGGVPPLPQDPWGWRYHS